MTMTANIKKLFAAITIAISSQFTGYAGAIPMTSDYWDIYHATLYDTFAVLDVNIFNAYLTYTGAIELTQLSCVITADTSNSNYYYELMDQTSLNIISIEKSDGVYTSSIMMNGMPVDEQTITVYDDSSFILSILINPDSLYMTLSLTYDGTNEISYSDMTWIASMEVAQLSAYSSNGDFEAEVVGTSTNVPEPAAFAALAGAGAIGFCILMRRRRK